MNVLQIVLLAATATTSGSPVATGPAVEPTPTENVLWQGRADLDADGVPEDIVVSSTDVTSRDRVAMDPAWANASFGGTCGENCRATIRIGTASRPLMLHLRSEDLRGALSVAVVGPSKKGSRKIVLLRQQTGDDEISWSDVSAALFVKGTLDVRSLWERTWPGNHSDVSTDGKGRILLRFDSCTQSTRVDYRVDADGKLIKLDEREIPNPDAAKCAG